MENLQPILKVKAYRNYSGHKKLCCDFLTVPSADNFLQLLEYAKVNYYTLDITLDYVNIEFRAELDWLWKSFTLYTDILKM